MHLPVRKERERERADTFHSLYLMMPAVHYILILFFLSLSLSLSLSFSLSLCVTRLRREQVYTRGCYFGRSNVCSALFYVEFGVSDMCMCPHLHLLPSSFSPFLFPDCISFFLCFTPWTLSTHERAELTFISHVLTDIGTHKSYLCTLELIRLKQEKK